MRNDIEGDEEIQKNNAFYWFDYMCSCAITGSENGLKDCYSAYEFCNNCLGHGIMPVPAKDVLCKTK